MDSALLLTRSVNVVKEDDAAGGGQVSLIAININNPKLAISENSSGDGTAKVEDAINLKLYTDSVGKGTIGAI